jgi:hypothetical protein
MGGNMKDEIKDGELLVPKERRDYPRVAVNVRVKYRILENDEADQALVKHFDPEKIFTSCRECDVVNVSTSGLLMYTEEVLADKSFVAINMVLPLPGLSCSCKAIAEVIRCDKEDKKYLVALKFLKVIHHDLNKFKYMTLTDLLDIHGGENIKLG